MIHSPQYNKWMRGVVIDWESIPQDERRPSSPNYQGQTYRCAAAVYEPRIPDWFRKPETEPDGPSGWVQCRGTPLLGERYCDKHGGAKRKDIERQWRLAKARRLVEKLENHT